MKMHKARSSHSICSRLFQREFDMENSDTGQIVYSVYAAPQHFDALMNVTGPSLQRFAVVWGEKPRYEVHELIEQALIAGVLSPVALLHLSADVLTIYLSGQAVALSSLARFLDRWEELASACPGGPVSLQVWSGNELECVDKANPIYEYGYDVLNIENFGVYGYDKISAAFDHEDLVSYSSQAYQPLV